MIYRLSVWSRVTEGYRLVGEMVCEIGAGGKAKGVFRYAREFLEQDGAFSVDPVSLPLRAEVFAVEHPGIFSVFEDSLPDDWGRRLLIRNHNLPRSSQNIPALLLALGSSGLGALSYSLKDQPPATPIDASVIQLSKIIEAAWHFERGEPNIPNIALLLGAGSSPGGGRPKALVFDESEKVHYIAKFSSIKDQVDVVKIEAATMQLASKAGLVVPPTKLVSCGSRSVLLVSRFDIAPAGRRHMASFQTLLKAHGYYQCRYFDVLKVLRKYSSEPADDSERLFRQMVFNALVGNTDDHLKNFWMLYDSLEGWRLSPAFDLLPDVGRNSEHVLFFDSNGYYPGRRNLEKLGKSWGVRNSDKIVDEVFSAVSGWKDEFSRAGIPEQEIASFGEIDEHLLRD